MLHGTVYMQYLATFGSRYIFAVYVRETEYHPLF